MNELPVNLPELMLSWYDRNRRILPWREDPAPYHTWLSEVMLQQTRVDTGIAYYERFLKVLPTIKDLAEADEQLLLKLWEGLGYYSRVRNLQKAAKIVMAEYGGELPPDFKALTKLPGLGEYSAGAIASIAFELPVPAVDGNVLRVIARIRGDDRNIEDLKIKKEVGEEIVKILPSQRRGDFNQSLMELGALVCLPNGKPLCESCPIREACIAHLEGIETALPVRIKKTKHRTEHHLILIVTKNNQVAIRQRPAMGLLASLWEFPYLENCTTASDAEILTGISMAAARSVGHATHLFSHITWEMEGVHLELSDDSTLFLDNVIFVSKKELLEHYPVPGAFQYYLNYVLSFLE